MFQTMSEALAAKQAAHATDLSILASLETRVAQSTQHQQRRMTLQSALDSEVARVGELRREVERLTAKIHDNAPAMGGAPCVVEPAGTRAQILI
mmetsp:Transcript_1637/g.3258  ORF Transcript_1637/g.3258 Transcript_1637/m.3258 type:complete len:94 (+) Transcript_1637:11-292(+)